MGSRLTNTSTDRLRNPQVRLPPAQLGSSVPVLRPPLQRLLLLQQRLVLVVGIQEPGESTASQALPAPPTPEQSLLEL